MIKTGQKNTKPFYKIKIRLNRASELIKEKWVILLCVLSLFSSLADTPVSAVALVFLQTAKYRITKCICAAASVLYFVSTVTATAFYIPYIAFVFIYLVADYLLENHKLKPAYPAVFTFAATKAYMLSFGFETAHWVLLILETAALIVLPQNVKNGFQLLKFNEECSSGENIFDTAAAFAVTALALDGVQVWGVQFSVAFLLCAGCFYGVKHNFTISFSAMFVMVMILCRNNMAAFFIAGYSAIFCAGLFFLPKGAKGYAGYLLASAAVAALCSTQFNSTVFVSSASVSAVGYFILSKLLKTENKYSNTNDDCIGENEYIQLKHNLEKLNRSFRFLGHTIIDISNLVNKDYIPNCLEDAVSSEVCRRCKNNTQCWQQNYSDTQKQFSRYAHILQNGGTPFFENRFMNQCDKTQQLCESFEKHSRLLSTQKLIHSQGRHNQRILQNQFLSMASVLQEISYQSSLSGVANTAFTHRANSFLSAMDKKINYCICYQNRDRCIVSMKDGFDSSESYHFKSRLENIYGTKFSLSSKESDGENMLYTFSAVPLFTAEYGVKSISRQTYCGDVWEYFVTEECAFAVLADGMGTGSVAQAEAKTAAVMIKSLVTAKVSVPTALEITNIALNLKGTGQSCVAIDILQINLYDGSCSLYKAGAAATVVSDAYKTEIMYRDSLPIGVLKDIKIVQFDFILNNGDTVVLASDGVDTDEKLQTKVRLTKDTFTPQQIADNALKDADSTDDATVAVIKLVRT